jgi:hypothetical protein
VAIPQPPSTLKAVYLGITGEDKVGELNQPANGKPDFHISVSGLRGTPTKVRITGDNGGTWELPFNGQNWNIATQYDGQGNGHYWFEQFRSKKFQVQVWYPDGTIDAADASDQASPAPSFSQSSVTFDNQSIGSPKVTKSVTLSNTGALNLNIGGFSASGDFTQSSNCPASLAPAAQCIISVSFQPLMPGPRAGTLAVITNAPGSPHSITLSGIGIATATVTDTIPPQVNISAPAAGASVSGMVMVTISASDNVGVTKTELNKDGIMIASAASTTLHYVWDTTNETNGNHTLIAVAYDAANNRSTATLTVNIQNTNKPLLGKRF